MEGGAPSPPQRDTALTEQRPPPKLIPVLRRAYSICDGRNAPHRSGMVLMRNKNHAGKKTFGAAKNPWVRAARSGIHGQGVYARVAIPDGTQIIEYVGERITKVEARRREQARLARERRGEDASVYVFELNRRYDLDGRTSRNLARLINHSCVPNCRAETIRGHIWIIARRDIPAGAELTFDYGFSLLDGMRHPCRCGAKRCAGFIVNANQRWRLRRRRA